MGLRVAILGAGRIGIVHGKAVRAAKEAELIAIAEPMEAVKSAAALFQCDIRSIDQIAASRILTRSSFALLQTLMPI